jgi:putative transposase
MGHQVYTEIIMKMKGKSKYNPRIHHRRSIRLKGYDYSQAGWYFITICCQGRICRFGHIENGEIILNEYGQIARDEWMRTTEIRPNVELGEFVIMPNHLHGIIQINYRRGELHSPQNTHEWHSPQNTNEWHTPQNSPERHSPNRNIVWISAPRGTSQTMGSIIRGYKSSVTKQMKLLGFRDK